MTVVVRAAVALLWGVVASMVMAAPVAAQQITLGFNSATSSAPEAAGFGNLLRVTTSDGFVTSTDATVMVSVTGGTATAADYILTGTITVPAGSPNGALVSIASGITVINDSIAEPHETMILTLSNPSAAILGATITTTHTITNDDVARVTVGDASMTEGNGAPSLMSFAVTLDRAVQGGFALDYTTRDNDAPGAVLATAGIDYGPVSGTLTFTGTAGESQIISVPIFTDQVVEGDETFKVGFVSALANIAPGGLDITDTAIGTILNDDLGAITIANVSQPENGTFTFTATLNSATAAPFAVDWTFAAGTTNAADYVGGVLPTGGTLSFAGMAGETWTFTVPVLDDTVVEPTENFTIGMANFTTTGGFALNIADTATGTITDNDTAMLTIEDVSKLEANSGTHLMIFSAVLDNAVQDGFTVNYATEDISATAGSDYVAATGTLSFSGTAGQSRTFTVTINGDAVVEPNETFRVRLNTVSKAGIDITDTAIGTIINDDAVGYVVDTTGTAPSIAEPSASTTFTVRLASQPSGTVILDFGSTDLSECSISPASFTFNTGNWNAPQTITISAVDDLIADGTQPCAATITRTGGTAFEYVGVPDPGNVNVNVTDNEVVGITVSPTTIAISESGSTATFALTTNTVPTGDVTVPITTDGQCEVDVGGGFGSSGTLTLPAGSMAGQTVTVRAVNDTIVEGAHTCAITTGNPSSVTDASYHALGAADVADVVANVADNDVLHTLAAGAGGAEGTGINPTFTFTVTRSGATTVASSVNYVLGGSGVSGTDYIALNPATDITGTGVTATATTLSFAVNASTATIRVTANADSIAEPDFTLDLILTSAVADAGAGTGVIAGSPASLTVTDDDVAGYVIDTTGTASSITEPAEATTFTIRLATQPAGTVILGFASTDLTECVVSPSSFTFNAGNWNAPQTITITAVDDSIVDGPQPCAATITRTGGSATEYAGVANPPPVNVSVTDNDTAGIVVTPTSGLITTEAGGTASFTVVLSSQPTAVVTLALTSSDVSEGTVSPMSLSFDALNWNVAQTVTVTGVDDAVADGDQPYTILLGAAVSADPSYNGIDPADVSVTNSDNDAPGVTVAPTAINATEGGAGGSYTLLLNSQPTAVVTIAVSTDAQTSASPTSVQFTPANWNVPQAITVAAIDDALAEGAHSGVITHAVSGADYTGVAVADVTVSITDNDTAGIVVTPTAGLITTEAGGTASFTVVLSSQPTAVVTMALTSSDVSEGTVSPTSLSFDTLNWNAAQTVTVTGVDDAIVDGTVPYSVLIAPAISSDPAYAGIQAGPVLLSNTDDDSASLSIADVSLAEGNSGSTDFVFIVTLSGQVQGGVTVDYTTADGSATAPADYAATSGTLAFDGNDGETRTVIVPVVGDTVVEGEERFFVRLSAPTPAPVVLARAEAIGTILEDDAGALLEATKRVAQVGRVNVPVIYEIVLHNAGGGDQADDPASDELVDLLPSSLELQSATASAGTVVADIAGNAVRWNGSLPAGASVTLQIDARVVATQAGPISNIAQLNYASNGDGSNDATATSRDPALPTPGPTVFMFAGVASPAPQQIPTLDPRVSWALLLCMGLIGGWFVRRQGR